MHSLEEYILILESSRNAVINNIKSHLPEMYAHLTCLKMIAYSNVVSNFDHWCSEIHNFIYNGMTQQLLKCNFDSNKILKQAYDGELSKIQDAIIKKLSKEHQFDNYKNFYDDAIDDVLKLIDIINKLAIDCKKLSKENAYNKIQDFIDNEIML